MGIAFLCVYHLFGLELHISFALPVSNLHSLMLQFCFTGYDFPHLSTKYLLFLCLFIGFLVVLTFYFPHKRCTTLLASITDIIVSDNLYCEITPTNGNSQKGFLSSKEALGYKNDFIITST